MSDQIDKNKQFIIDLEKHIPENLNNMFLNSQISQSLNHIFSDYNQQDDQDAIYQWGNNLTDLMLLSQKFFSNVLLDTNTKKHDTVDPLGLNNYLVDIWTSCFKKPEIFPETYIKLWQNYIHLCQESFQNLTENSNIDTSEIQNDRRFKAEVWNEPTFDFIKKCYFMISDNIFETINLISDDVDDKEKKRRHFFTKQYIDAMSPSNFLLTNPEAIQETLKTGGKNLVKGMENLLHDLERGNGKLKISQTDFNAFKVGENLATTPGYVVYRNEIMELIHYTPTTEKTFAIPLLILPPFINKYYILDMRPENSMIKWLVSQGYSVFVASWKNPTKKHASFSFNNYIDNGLFEAINAIRKMTGQKKISAVGYCIAGTMLTMALARMQKKGQDFIKNATYFASQTDFSDAGELSLFIDEERIKAYEKMMQSSGGILEGVYMGETFNMLRANDLIWSFVVNNYLLGKDPFPFDLLYWNSDTTNIPMKLQLDYLKSCYMNNDLAENRFKIGNILLEPNLINIPMYIQSSKEDHIAPAASVYKSTKLFSGLLRFITAGSGHIAGVINHPDKNKYQYWTNDELPQDYHQWLDTATEHAGSWWLDWHNWLQEQSQDQVKAFQPAKEWRLEKAPGTYVHE